MGCPVGRAVGSLPRVPLAGPATIVVPWRVPTTPPEPPPEPPPAPPPAPALTGQVLTAPVVVTSREVLSPGWVHVVDGLVAAVGPGRPPLPDGATEVVALAGTVVPGFVDAHCHGGGGAAFAEAPQRPAAVPQALAVHAARGTTTVVASLVTAERATLRRQVAALAEHAQDGAVAGLHLEGPWLAARHCGAHDPDLVRPPTADEVHALLTAGRGTVVMATLAPELDGAAWAVRALVGAGVVAAVGHTGADAATTRTAFDAGARVATHVFNGMRALHHREPGAAAASLLDHRVAVEVVLDGEHLADEAAELVRRLVGPRLVLVSDATAAAVSADADYRLGGLAVRVRGGTARLAGDSAVLAGSTLTLDRAFARLVAVHGATLPEAVTATATRPAAVLGLDGPGGVGDLVAGSRADLVVLDDAHAVTAVMRRGEWLPAG